MEFQILSHAGLRIRAASKELIFDPWLIGSCYWRSWWNFPPVKADLIASLSPSAIYLTHIHWDHFQGPSLRLFDKSTLILAPSGNYDRIKRDLNAMGFHNVVELNHGNSYSLAEDFKITSYHFGPFLDSAVIVEAEGKVLFNANDAKFMGGPLADIIRRHGQIDFVFRSHSSANSRLCYEYMDDPAKPVDNIEQYIKNFADFCQATGAKYAIPFASNHCFLHEEVFDFNNTIQTPKMVEDYFVRSEITAPVLKAMVSGDSWSSDDGFHISGEDYFSNRDERLAAYKKIVQDKLEKSYIRESKIKLNVNSIHNYFKKFSASIPWVLRYLLFREFKYLYVLRVGDNVVNLAVDIYNGDVMEVHGDISKFDVQIHTSALIFYQCVTLDLFSHLAISKRVIYRVKKSTQKRMTILNLMFNCYEYDLFPVRKIFTARSLGSWARRWREIGLYICLVKDLVLFKKLNQEKYLRPSGKTLRKLDPVSLG